MRFLLIVLCALLLSACDGTSDLKQFVARMKALKPTPIEPLPEVPDFKPMKYEPDNERSPFAEPKPEIIMPATKIKDECVRPKVDRAREPLEKYSLNNLTMSGSLGKDGALWALIKTNDGTTYRVGLKQRMGLNHGQVIKITHDWVELEEFIPDGKGCWAPRITKLTMVGSESN
ncbi:pilus assembly protein PilP [Dongshaea marina]|uniref:pilus assembly protein PilP n=1 Tax=Dongshaea marina TaxID=2047966 RepID=UPI000D3ED545|nr:pilus assembly protein PilP [Dongshaea marina]